MINRLSKCPSCSNALVSASLKCPCCGLELRNDFEMSPFDRLDSEQNALLTSFLKNRGNLQAVQSDLKISYPTAKKRLDELLVVLGLCNASSKAEPKELDISRIQVDDSSNLASEIVKRKLKEHGGHITVYTARGLPCEVYAGADGHTFSSDKLPSSPAYDYSVLDVIVDLLLRQGGRARKGNGRNNRFGQPGCDETTVVGAIAKSKGHRPGDSVFDPVFVLAAILSWAGIAENGRGELIFTPEYKKSI